MRKTNEDSYSRLREVSELELFFQLEQMKASNLSESKEKDAIINERNKAWLRKMPGIMESGSTLFAVGAGHLVGSDGLIAMLIDAGYEVEPVEKPMYERME